MTTININLAIVLKAAQHALIEAEADYVVAIGEYELNSKCKYLSDVCFKVKLSAHYKCERLKTIVAAAKVCNGDMCMSLDDVGMIREWL